MKALVKKHAAPGLWVEEVPEPTPGINDVLIRVRYIVTLSLFLGCLHSKIRPILEIHY